MPALDRVRDALLTQSPACSGAPGTSPSPRTFNPTEVFKTAIDFVVDDIRLLSPLESSMERQKTMRAK